MSRPARSILILFAAALGLAFVAGLVTTVRRGQLGIWGASYYTDGDTIRDPAPDAPLRDILWQPPVPLPDSINSADHEDYEPRLSADALSLFFVRGKAGEQAADAGVGADIYLATRTPTGWSDPLPLDALNSAYDDLGPEPSPDAAAIFFASNRPGGHGGYDLWASRRDGDSWSEPTNLGPAINSPFDEHTPALAPSAPPAPHEGLLYFASNRPGPNEAPESVAAPWGATIRENAKPLDYDLYVAPLIGGVAGDPHPLLALNTDHNEGAPAVSPAGDFLYFTSDRPGGLGAFDLYRSRLLRARFLPPTNLGVPLNSPVNELDPALSLGGFAIHFSSDRSDFSSLSSSNPGDTTLARAAPDYNLYTSASREVFLEHEPRSATFWSDLWPDFRSVLWPILLWLLLALLALILLLALARDLRDRRLGLLAKCLIASLLAHLAILFLLNLWGVTTSIGELFKRPGGAQVTLASDSASDALATQIRGRLTDIPIAPAPSSLSTTPELPFDTAPPLALAVLDTPRTDPLPDLTLPQSEPRDATRPTPVPTPAFTQPVLDLGSPDPVDLATPQPTAPSGTTEPALPAPARPTPVPPRPPTLETDSALAATSLTPPRTALPLDAPLTTSSPHDAPTPDPAPSVSAALLAGAILPGSAGVSETVVALPPSAPTAQSPEPAPATAGTAPVLNLPRPNIPTLPDALPPAQLTVSTPPHAPAAPAPDRSLAPPIAAGDASVPSPAEPQRNVASLDLPSTPPPPLSIPSESLPTTGAGSVTAEPEPAPILARAARLRHPSLPIPSHNPATAIIATAPPPTLFIDTPTTAVGIQARDAAPLSTPAPSPPPQAPTTPLDPPTLAADITLPSDAAPAAPVLSAIQDNPTLSTTLAPPVSPSSRRLSPNLPQSDAPLPAAAVILPPHSPGAPVPTSLSMTEPVVRDAVPSTFSLPTTTPLAIPLGSTPLAADLRLPTETAPPPLLPPPADQYAQRAPGVRENLLERLGGSDDTERAVDLALKWLAAHQSDDGRWDSDGFDRRCGRCAGVPAADSDSATTGLALLCFLGADHTHTKDGPYRDHVRRALGWLLDQQTSTGDLRRDETMYSHGIAAIALSEAYGMTRDPALAGPVGAAVRFIVASRHTDRPGRGGSGAGAGGWRYEPRQPGDTSVLGWQAMALTSARRAGIDVPEPAFEAAAHWLDSVSTGSPGLYAYQPGMAPTPAMTAEGLFVRQLLGRTRDEPMMRSSVAFVSQHLPDWDNDPSTYYWYYATLALFQHGGDDWTRWNEALKPVLLAHQRTDGPAAGSWDPVDKWSTIGGRIYQTAMCTMSLEVYYRYLPLYATDRP